MPLGMPLHVFTRFGPGKKGEGERREKGREGGRKGEGEREGS